MKFKLGLLLLAFSIGTTAFAQYDCDPVVSDNPSFKGRTNEIAQAAQAVINQGADVRVRDIQTTSNLDYSEAAYRSACPSWQSAEKIGVQKNTLIVLMVASQSRKLGIYYGAAWHNALDDHWNRIKTDYMAPRFKDGDFAGGMIAALEQLAKRLAISKDEALHPKTYTTINQEAPTDLSWLWGFLGLGFIVLLAWASWKLFTSKTAKQEKISGSQQLALAQRTKAANLLRKLQNDIEDAKATQTNGDISRIQATVDSASELFSNLSNSEKTNPDTPNLHYWEYDSIMEQYRSVYDGLETAQRELWLLTHPTKTGGIGAAGAVSGMTQEQVDKDEKCEDCGQPSNHPSHVRYGPDLDNPRKHKFVMKGTPVESRPIPAATQVSSSQNAAIFIDEPIREEHTSRQDSDDDQRSSSSSSSSDDDSGGGGSSDFGSSDSGGGGSSDSGSSDSGSSDSGGGGSSDF